MKNYRSTFVLLFIFGTLAVAYFLFYRGKSSIQGEDANFAVKDTANISQINLTFYRKSKAVQRSELKKQGQNWLVNQYKASNEKISVLLNAIYRLQVREPVHPNAKDNVIKMLATDHVRVEIKQNDGSEKVYFVGEEPPIGTGSMMMLNGATEPYIVEIPGHHGYLKPFYSAYINDWRENILFNIPPKEVSYLSVKYPGADSSFELIRKGEGFVLATGELIDSTKLTPYLAQLGKKAAQSFIDREMPNGLDSLKKLKPDIVFIIANQKNERTKIYLFNRPDNVNTYMGWVVGKDELLLIQRFNMDGLLVRRKDLLIHKSS